MSTASHGIFWWGTQWVHRKVVQKSFQGAPVGMAAVIGFHDPKLCGAVSQRVGDLPKLDGVNNLVMRYGSSLPRNIAVRHGVGIIVGCN